MSRILLISDRRPAPGHGGGERTLAIYNALKKIAEVDVLLIPLPGQRISAEPGEHVVHLLEDPERATKWYLRWRAYLLKDYRADRKVRKQFNALVEARRYDAFFGRYHASFLADCKNVGPSFVDIDDVPTDMWSSALPFFDHVRRLALFRALSGYKTVFVTKRSDISKIRHPDIQVLPCISTRAEVAGATWAENDNPQMLFVGGMGWHANRDGIQRFIEKSLPTIRSRFPNASLRIVGSGGRNLPVAPGVDIADFVPDLVPEYQRTGIVICPIRTGGGAIVKLAEAAAFGVPLVATSHAARGYEGLLEPGRDLLVADSDQDFAQSCIRLLEDRSLRAALSQNALRSVAGRLDQAAIDNIVRAAVAPWLQSGSQAHG